MPEGGLTQISQIDIPPLPQAKTRKSEAPLLLAQKKKVQKSSIIVTALRSHFKNVLHLKLFKKRAFLGLMAGFSYACGFKRLRALNQYL